MNPNKAHTIIVKLYHELLEREPDQGGYISYYNHLTKNSRDESWIRNSIANSKERQNLLRRKQLQQLVKKTPEQLKKEEEKRKKDEEQRKKEEEEAAKRWKEKIDNITVVGGMTTIPSRINLLQDTIKSIKEQSFKISKLVLTIPHKLRRNGATYEIPKWIEDDPFIHIHRMDDFGPVCKILGAIEYVKDPETFIATFDDDIIYSDDTMKNLITGYLMFPGAAYACSGLKIAFTADTPHFRTQRNAGPTNILEGWAGALYQRKFFKNDVHQMLPTSFHCFFSDDLIISNYLRKHKVPLFQVKRPRAIRVRNVSGIDPLFAGANGLTYRTFKRYSLGVLELRFLKKFYLL